MVKSTRPLREVEILAMRYAHDTDVGVRRAAVFALVGVVYNDHSRCQAVEAVVRGLAVQAKKEVEKDQAAPAADVYANRLQRERNYWHRFLERAELNISYVLEREKDMIDEASLVAVDRMGDSELLNTADNPNPTLAMEAVNRLTDTWGRTTQHFDELLKLAHTSPAGYEILLKIGLPVPESASPQEKENWDLLAASVNTLPEKALRFGEGSGGDPRVTFLLHLGDEETLRRIREKTDADTSEVRPYGLDVVREGVLKFLRDPNAWPPQLRDVVWRLTGRGNHESILVRMKPDIEELRARVDAGKIAFKFDEHKQKLIDAIDDALSRIAELEAAGQMEQNRTE